MSVDMKWNLSGSRELPIVGSAKWQEMGRAIRFSLVGYGLMAFGILLAALLVSSAVHHLATQFRVPLEETMLVGYIVAGSALTGGYLLMLAGQFRCLLAAPQGNGSKELLFASLLCLITMVFALISGHLLGGAENYELLTLGGRGLAEISFVEVGGALQALALVLGLAGALLYVGFLRGLADYLRCPSAGPAVFFWFVAFLVGGTVGAFLNARFISNSNVWHALALGWSLGLVWHLGLIYSTLSSLKLRLSGQAREELQSKGPASGLIALRDGSFFRQ